MLLSFADGPWGGGAVPFVDGPHPLHCPTKFEELWEATMGGAQLYNEGKYDEGKRLLTNYIYKWANENPTVGMECSLGREANENWLECRDGVLAIVA